MENICVEEIGVLWASLVCGGLQWYVMVCDVVCGGLRCSDRPRKEKYIYLPLNATEFQSKIPGLQHPIFRTFQVPYDRRPSPSK